MSYQYQGDRYQNQGGGYWNQGAQYQGGGDQYQGGGYQDAPYQNDEVVESTETYEKTTVPLEEKTIVQKEGSACGNMCCGCLLVPLTILAIFWNETNFIRDIATANVMRNAVRVLDCRARPFNMGKLVFVTNCDATQPDLAEQMPDVLRPFLPDGYAGASLEWSLEIKQWDKVCHTDETCHKTGDGKESCTKVTRCHDEQQWESDPSSTQPVRHNNYGRWPDNLYTASVDAPIGSIYFSATHGDSREAFWVNGDLVAQFPSGPAPLRQPSHKQHAALQSWRQPGLYSWQSQGAQGDLRPEMLYISSDGVLQTGNNVGDIRITVTGTQVTSPSVFAMQTYDHRRGGVSFTTYPSQPFNFWGQTTKPLEWLVDMPESEQDLIDEYKGGSKMTLWVVRIIGFVVMLCAFKCIFEPLSVATELLQYLNYCTCCLGSVLEKASQAVINVVSCSFACSCFCVVFGLAWLAARPTYAVVSLGVVAIGLGTVLLLHMGGKKAASRELKIPLVSAKGGPPEQHFKCVTLP